MLTGVSSVTDAGAAPGAGPADLKRAAEAFEALFLTMLLKSMRDTVPEGGLFDSRQLESYHEMHDRELAKDLARRKSLGIAELIVRQLDPTGPATVPSSLAPVPSSAHASPFSHATASALANRSPPTPAQVPSPIAPAAADLKTRFIQKLLPAARRYAPRLGQPVAVLIAQAALETGWGRAVPRDAEGRSSHNLFGIKTGASWNGARVRAATAEYQNNQSHRTSAEFRAYRSPDASFADYVSLISKADRYRAAREAGDTPTYLHSLADGGYATDPNYARKVLEILNDPALARLDVELKKSARRPLVQALLTSAADDAQ